VVLDFLDDHSGSMTALLTIALVLVTAYYARQNHRMAEEMENARKQTVLPKVALGMVGLTPTMVALKAQNVGQGAAFDVDIALELVPHDVQAETRTVRWRSNLIAPGEENQFLVKGDDGDLINTDELSASYREIRLVGTLRDALGDTHHVSDTVRDVAEWRDLLTESHQRWRDEPETRLAKAIAKELKRPLGEIATEIGKLESSGPQPAAIGALWKRVLRQNPARQRLQ
jgi:hypothetical protein